MKRQVNRRKRAPEKAQETDLLIQPLRNSLATPNMNSFGPRSYFVFLGGFVVY